MNLLDRMQHVLQEEHKALLAGDWQALEECVVLKRQLSDELTLARLEPEQKQQAMDVRQAVAHNTELSSALSKHLGAIIARQPRASTYTGYGRVADTRQAIVHLRG